jgi:hypothetical protein
MKLSLNQSLALNRELNQEQKTVLRIRLQRALQNLHLQSKFFS